MKRPRRLAAAVVLALVALLLSLGVPAASAQDTSGQDAAGTSEQALRIDVRDGPGRTQPQSLDATLYLPARTPAPAVLLAHGFGQTKDAVAGEARSLAARGYVVLAWSARGFGASTGQIALNSPDYEVADASQLVDWLAARPEVRLDAPGRSAGGGHGRVLRRGARAAARRLRPPGRRRRPADHLERPRPGAVPERRLGGATGRRHPRPRRGRGRRGVQAVLGVAVLRHRVRLGAGVRRAGSRRVRPVPAAGVRRLRRGGAHGARTAGARRVPRRGPPPPRWPGGSRRRRCWSRARTTPCSASTRPTPPPARSPPGAAPSPSRGSTAGTTAGPPTTARTRASRGGSTTTCRASGPGRRPRSPTSCPPGCAAAPSPPSGP